MSHRNLRIQEIRICNQEDLDTYWSNLNRGQNFYVSEYILERIDYSYFGKAEKYLKTCKLRTVKIRECCSTANDMRRLLRAIKQNYRERNRERISLDIRENSINSRGVEELCKLVERQSITSLAMPEGLDADSTLEIVRSFHTACSGGDFKIRTLIIRGSNLADKTVSFINDMIVKGMIVEFLDLRDCTDGQGLFLRDFMREILQRSLMNAQGLKVEWFQTCSNAAIEPVRPRKNLVKRYLGWAPDIVQTAAHGFLGTFTNPQAPLESQTLQRDIASSSQMDFSGMQHNYYGVAQPPMLQDYSGIPMDYRDVQANYDRQMRNADINQPYRRGQQRQPVLTQPQQQFREWQQPNFVPQERFTGMPSGNPGIRPAYSGFDERHFAHQSQTNDLFPSQARQATEYPRNTHEHDARATNSLGADVSHPEDEMMQSDEEHENHVAAPASIDIQQQQQHHRRPQTTRGPWNLRTKIMRPRRY